MADAPAHRGGGTVNILGHPVKKNTALIGGAAAIGVIIIAIMRKRSAGAAASAPGTGMVTDPAGNQCSALNAATGYCPGTPQDVAAQQSAADGAALSSAADAGAAAGGGGGGYYIPTATGTSATGSAVPAFTDNASWAQYAETALGSNGADPVAAAVAKYLSGQPVTPAQQTTIEEAIAIANRPPVTGANGFPPSMNLAPSGGGGGTPPPAAAKVRVPEITGDDVANAGSAIKALGLKMTPYPAAVKGKTHVVTAQNPGSGAIVAKGSTVTIKYKTT
jgi:hypothetical protein